MLDSEPAAGKPTDADRYIDDVAAASMLGLSRSYLRQLRLTGGGPRFATFGRAVRYRISELHAWAETKSARSTTDRQP